MPKIRKVTDPAKIVTDGVVIKELARQGIDKDYVEFSQDYAPRRLGGGRSPYAKFYRDLKSGKQFMVVSGLPKVKPDGQKIEVGFTPPVDTPAGKFRSKANLFLAEIDNREVTLTCLSDQPTGAKKDDQVTYRPQLFLDGVEIVNGEQPTLLPIDPINEDIKENTLEWVYGNVAKRRVRILQGRYRDKFIIVSHPHAKVSVKHNFIGNLKLRLGSAYDAEGKRLKVSVIGDEEIVEASEFDNATFPVEIGATLTVYPDAHEETATVDGSVDGYQANQTWHTIVTHAGFDARDDHTYLNGVYIGAGTTAWSQLQRSIFLFDTSALTADAIISAATLSLRYAQKQDNLSCTPDVNIYSSAPASNTELVAGDFDSLGTTAFCDTPITYANWVADTYSLHFAFNAAGLAAIDKEGISKFGARNANYDVADELDPGNHDPNYIASQVSYLRNYYADLGSTQPKLVVTYTVITEKSSSDTGSGADAKLSLAVALIKADSGSGVEHILDRALALISESGSGLDTVLSLLRKIIGDSGTGAENSYLHILEGVKDSSDSGSGAEASSLAALFQRDETGEGVESVVARALFSREPQMGAIDLARVLAAAITGAETGTGAEASLMAYYQKKADSGEGVDSSTLEALFTGEDSGAGAEAITLLAAMVSHDTGVGIEAVIEFFRKLIDSGQGEENLLLVGYVGRAMKLITYLRAYSDLVVYTKPYSDLRVYSSEVKQ